MSSLTSSVTELRTLVGSLPIEEKSAWSVDNVESLLDAVKTLNKQQSGSSRTRGILRRVDPLIKFLRRFAKYGDLIVQSHPFPACIAWSSLRILLEILGGFTSYFEELLDMLESIDEKFPLFEKFAEMHSDSPACSEALAEIYSDVVLFLYKAQTIFKRRAMRALIKTLWKSCEEEFKSRQRVLERHIEQFGSAVEFAHQQTLQFNKRRDLMQWLAPVDVKMELQRIGAKRTRGTGAWIHDNTEYIQWRDNPTEQPLWIRGRPGTGKTVLSTAIIEDLQQQETTNSRYATAFYFFDKGESEKSGFTSWICSIIAQLVARLDSIPEPLMRAYMSSAKLGRSKMTLTDGPVELLELLITSFSAVFLVLDGLDEATETDSTHEALARLTGQPHVRIICPSRRITPTLSALSTSHTISLDDLTVTSDINKYLKEEIATLQQGCGTHDLDGLLYPRVSEGAKGNFLWAHLMMETLKSASSVFEMIELTKQVPEGLSEMYTKTLRSYNSKPKRSRNLLKRIFIWICTSASPLKWRELQHAIALDPDDVTLEPLRMPIKASVIQLCSPLVLYSEQEDAFRPLHSSVVEYLLSADSEDSLIGFGRDTASFLLSTEAAAHFTAVITCLKYLSFPPLDTTVHWNDDILPLTSYATTNLCRHVTSAGMNLALEAPLRAFLASTDRRRIWLTRWLLLTVDQAPLQNILRQQRESQPWLNSFRQCDVTETMDFLEDTLAVLIQLDDIPEPDNGNRSAFSRTTVAYFDRMTAIRDLSRAFTISDKLQEGVTLLQDALERQTVRFGPESEEIVWILQSLGILFDQEGDYQAASEMQCKSLEIQRKVLPEAHLDIVWTKDELGRVYKHLKNLVMAEKMQREALEALELTLPQDAMMTTATRNALARTYRLQGKVEEALEQHRRALSAQERTRGMNHAHTLWTITDIAKCLRDLGRNEEAYDQMMTALHGRRELLGPNHADTLWSMNDIGLMLTSLGRRDEARKYHEEARDKQIAVLGPQHPFTIWTIDLLNDWGD